MNNSNLPLGAEYDKNAPWNETINPAIPLEIVVGYDITKRTKIVTQDYEVEDWDDWELDDEGYPIHTGGTKYDFSQCDTSKEFEHQYYDPVQLIDELKHRVEKELKDDNLTDKQVKHLNKLLKSCEGWVIDSYYTDRYEP